MEVDIIYGLAIAAVILFTVAQLARIVRSAAMHRTLRLAIEKGQPLDAALIERLDRSPDPTAIDQRIGFVLIAIGLALIAAGLIGPGFTRGIIAMSMFPLFVGAALLLRLRLAKPAE